MIRKFSQNKYFILCFVLSICFSLKVFSQTWDDEVNKQAFLTGTWGYTRSIFAINYERFFNVFNADNIKTSARTGIGYSPGSKSINAKGIVAIPVLFTLLYGHSKHFFVSGIGYTGSFGQTAIDSSYSPPVKYPSYESAISLNLGYRYMEYKGATFEIIPVSLILTNNPVKKFEYSFSIILGYAF